MTNSGVVIVSLGFIGQGAVSLMLWGISLGQAPDTITEALPTDNVTTLLIGIIAAAMTFMTGLTGLLVKRTVAGEMVHKSYADITELLRRSLEIIERAEKREGALLDHFLNDREKSNRQ